MMQIYPVLGNNYQGFQDQLLRSTVVQVFVVRKLLYHKYKGTIQECMWPLAHSPAPGMSLCIPPVLVIAIGRTRSLRRSTTRGRMCFQVVTIRGLKPVYSTLWQ